MKALVLTGPTAAGKTAVAMALADRCPVRLISVDSAMVYRRMDIGTAKPAPDVLRQYPHALVDIREPHEPYTVADFVADADREVNSALAAGVLPVLVGGTMMYLRAFREGLDAVPRSTEAVRREVAERAEVEGWPALHRRLQEIDPVAAGKIHPNNPQRLARALEVHALTGEPISSFWGQAQTATQRLEIQLSEWWIDAPDRASLHGRIATRLDEMFDAGFVDEVKQLRADADVQMDLPALRAVGYRQVWRFLDGDYDAAQMREKVLAATRGLARRQYTWLRRWSDLQRLPVADATGVGEAAAQVHRLAIQGGSRHSD